MDQNAEAGSMFWVEEVNGLECTQMRIKRKAIPWKREFVGWGSKDLFDFLHSIGKSTEQKLSQYDVSGIINEYVNKNSLNDRIKKKKIHCDEKLYFLFGKKTISRNKIYEMLEVHFADNCLESEDDSFLSSEDENNALSSIGKQATAERKPLPKKKVKENPKSCFAAIKPFNVKLIYLKKSLVQQLLKDPESFETKVVGSFVRIRSDPNDYLQKNSHQLLQVTGVKKGSGKEEDVRLEVSNLFKEISIAMLSDDNFSEAECEDLHRRVDDGLLKRPTVVEMQEKVRILHEDVTRKWLDGELVLLQNLINRANEKGWRRELDEYLDRRQLLQNPDEQARLLHDVPEVVAEDLEPECPQEVLTTPEEENELQNTIEIPAKQEKTWYVGPDIVANAVTHARNMSDTIIKGSSLNLASEFPVDTVAANAYVISWAADAVDHAGRSYESPLVQEQLEFGDNNIAEETCVPNPGHTYESPLVHKQAEFRDNSIVEETCVPKDKRKLCQEKVNKEVPAPVPSRTIDQKEVPAPPQVIELSDDDDEFEESTNGMHMPEEVPIPLNCLMWYYEDPQANVQGPFTLADLKHWSDGQYFPPDFKVWKTGQTKKDAVLLTVILHKIFH